ncbi:MAG TPA: IS110 family transposase [Ignavibacteriaceae bacterium]|nr:IS110 family transposase [Ignavibacteriaceae bacterium]
METQVNTLNFNSQLFYLGLDVHKKQWTVTIRSNRMELKTFSIDPSAEILYNYMQKNYPGGIYYTVYEAGFCGYYIHRQLEGYGFNSIITSPTDIPTSNKEKNQKRDSVDSRKLARELENGSLKSIYIPDQLHQELRSIVRQRFQLMKKQSRVKNQIKSYLLFYGQRLPGNWEVRHWSKNFIEYLRGLEFNYQMGKEQIEIYLEELMGIRELLLRIMKQIRKYLTEYNFTENIRLLCTIPGVGFTSAIIILTEIMDPERFPDLDNLASFVGLVPTVLSSDQKKAELGIKYHRNKYLRELLIESAWVAVRQDPALTCAYNNYVKRMSKQESIIRVAKKLLSRIIYVWKNKMPYVNSVVK